jgi:hypothetical protein
MDAVGRVLCESEHEKGPHKPNFRKSKRGQICCQRCCLGLWPVVALLLTTGNWIPFITTCDFSRVCLLLCEPTSGRFATKEYFWFHAESLWSFIAMIQEHVLLLRCCHCFNRGTWRLDKDISSLLMWLEYNLAGKYGYHLPRPLIHLDWK